jgi:hypothetical protein
MPIRLFSLQGGVLSFKRLHAKPPRTWTAGGGAHTGAPLLVSLQGNEVWIITQRVSCLDFFVLILEKSYDYEHTIICPLRRVADARRG